MNYSNNNCSSSGFDLIGLSSSIAILISQNVSLENLDILARQFLWNDCSDYLHGTGHGLGNLLSVHEGPCNIKWRYLFNEPISINYA